MKVAFNARLLAAPTLRGWNRYAINLLAELPALDVKLFLYSDQPLHPSHLARLPKDSYQVTIAPPMPYLLWEQYWLPKQCEKDRVEILHSPFNFGLPWSSPCPCVLTLHDAIDRVYYSQHTSWQQQLSFAAVQNRLYHWVARNRADRVITVSHHSQKDIVKHLHIPNHKITVIYEAADARFYQLVSDAERLRVRSQYALSCPYFFYVGGWEKRKNIPFLVRAFAAANLDGVELVLAGGREDQRTELVKLAESLNVSERVRLLGWVDDEDLPALYAEALSFVYPSEYEGFGLQLCEAMAVGCPVLAARATSLPEVLGDGGETFALSQIKELVIFFRRLTSDPSYRCQLASRAKIRSHQFNWKQNAIQTEKIYMELAHDIPKFCLL